MKMKVREVSADDPLLYSAIYARLTEEQRETYRVYTTLSTELYVYTLDGEFVCLWGFIPDTLLSDNVFVWSETSPLVEKCKTDFIRATRHAVRYIFSKYRSITGVCDPSVGSTRWLRTFRAKFAEPRGNVLPFIIRSPYG